ncbi:cryptochrome/photolyase family protein [Actinoplanes sp. NPDC051470]|uniref:cryptochrome/photolyase family protein n=1 Tax=Actinoplanes sp. NPDC051470 TaxID=3157224 RepID=UPI003431D3BE
MDGAEPAGGRWNLDADNREPPPRTAALGVPEPPKIVEDEIDEQVRADLDRWEREDGVTFLGRDGPRLFPATRREALARLNHFVEHRLPTFGRYEDAMLAGDPWMAHSLLPAPINLSLLDPIEVIHRAEDAHRAGDAPLASVEGFRPADPRPARLRLAPLLVLRAGLPPRQRTGRRRPRTPMVRRSRRRLG